MRCNRSGRFQHTTYMDVGSADHTRSSYLPLHPWRYKMKTDLVYALRVYTPGK